MTDLPSSGSDIDAEGFLRDLDTWSPERAVDIAAREQISLTPAHWEIIELVRRYYRRYDSSPSMRPLVKCCASELGADKGKSLYLLSLFPGSPAKLVSKIAGLPKPPNCL
ncbi:MAG: TusE/DsrC/DsvC family sulfur relay protein [Chromatocurvus sp.]